MVVGVTLWLLAATVATLPLLIPRGFAQSAPVDAVALLYVLLALAGLAGFSRQRRAVHLPAKGPLLLILVASLTAIVFGLSVPDGMLSLLVEAYLVLLFVCVANDLGSDRRALQIVLTTWTAAALIWAALFIAFHNQLLPDALQRLLEENSKGGGYRVSGTTKNPNLAASYMMTSFFVLLSSPWPRRRATRAAAAGWLLAGVYVTGSNGATLGLVTGALVLGVATCLRAGRTPGQRLGVAGGAVLATILTLTVVLVTTGIPRMEVSGVKALAEQEQGGTFGGSIGRLDRSVGGRLELWSAAWSAGPHLLTGVGPGAAPRIPLQTGSTLGRSLHNDYLAFLLERGILGLLGLLCLCLVLLRWSGRLLGSPPRDTPGERLRPAGLGAAVAANLVLATNHESFHFRHVWILFGLVWASNQLLRRELAHAGS
jgi:O-antigen ligase